ncbi:MAG: hypothetical protein JW943_01955 [Deltaproteobacteria bacterium]|nr:hypothetical protein [Deltaproteobacteria bacterium]
MIGLNQKGNVLLYAVIAVTAISVLGTGIYFFTTTSTFGGLWANNQNRAYQLALTGKDYALTQRDMGNDVASKYPNGFTLANGDKFRLAISGDTITSTGIVNENTPYEARRTITVTKTGFSRQEDISFAKDMGAIGVTQITGDPSDPTAFISKSSSTVSLGKIGVSYRDQFGAAIYSGSAVQGNCVDGECEFGTGFNAFFVFQFASGSTGDGFTFTFFNGSNNNSTSIGGYAGRGELMGYAGTSYVSPGYYLDGQGGLGIQAPKVAIEFDPYSNGSDTACNAESRYDATRNHMALMFWGDNTTYCNFLNGSAAGRYSFDDNRHGSGTDSAADPMNAKSPFQTGWSDCNYFNGNSRCTGADLGWGSDWLLNAPDNVYAMRVEVTRSLTQNGSNNYDYRIKVWLEKCGSGDLNCAAYSETSNLANTKVSYTDTNPKLDRSIQLDEPHHQAFNTTLFGWTTATGGATQEVNISRFRMNFQ